MTCHILISLCFITIILSSCQAVPQARYKIGDLGPAGGLIFYVHDETVDGWRYMEVAPVDSGLYVCWSTNYLDISGATDTNIGAGKANTAAIIAIYGSNSGYAAGLCDSAVINGYDDWFLPSLGEINAMFVNLYEAGTNGYATRMFYWTSSQLPGSTNFAWHHFDPHGYASYGPYGKGYEGSVRAVRSFE